MNEVTIVVDGVPSNGHANAASFIKAPGTPVRVDVTLPSRSYTIRRLQGEAADRM